MKKLTLLCTRAQQEETLRKLRDLEVLHVTHINAPEGVQLEQARNHLLYVQRAKEVLHSRPAAAPSGNKDPHRLVDAVWKLIHKEKELKETLQALEHEHARILPFGDFDPHKIEQLIEHNLFIKLYELPIKTPPTIPDGVAVSEISRDKNTLYILAVGRQEFSIPAHEVRLPDRSLSQINHHIEKAKADLEKTEAEFQEYAGDKHLAEQIVNEAADGVAFLEVLKGMGSKEAVVYLKGFYPVDRENDIVAAAQEKGWGYALEEVSSHDMPPTLLRNPKWVSPIKAVLGMIGVVPGYNELDISALFLLFLSIFFAFLIGDAGYGLLFIAISVFLKMKLRNNEKAANGLNLLLIMSGCTVIWGFLTGSFFGISWERLPAPLRSLSIGWLTGNGDPDIAKTNVMLVCFTLGAIHLTIAHAWNLVLRINSWDALGNLGWLICTWFLYFLTLNMVLNMPYPFPEPWFWRGVGIGALLITVALIMKREIIGLITLALNIISNFVDIISYVRLYAVGAASFAIANSFNEMAIGALGSKGILVGGLIAALCIFGGHMLNIVLGAMGILVHGIRLNTLEFSGHAGVQWGGERFNPFKKI